jgi:hypothetical protein
MARHIFAFITGERHTPESYGDTPGYEGDHDLGLAYFCDRCRG